MYVCVCVSECVCVCVLCVYAESCLLYIKVGYESSAVVLFLRLFLFFLTVVTTVRLFVTPAVELHDFYLPLPSELGLSVYM